jgi:DNA-directed RNA polymerase sigma subunit (sigma70/sigma32)
LSGSSNRRGASIPYGAESEGLAVELASNAASAEALLSAAEERALSDRSLNAALLDLSARILQECHSGPGKMNMAAIARGIGLSRERVRQIEERAREKVRKAMELGFAMQSTR